MLHLHKCVPQMRKIERTVLLQCTRLVGNRTNLRTQYMDMLLGPRKRAHSSNVRLDGKELWACNHPSVLIIAMLQIQSRADLLNE
eukprot:542027-Pleurochrysis_carterae.AAC.1